MFFQEKPITEKDLEIAIKYETVIKEIGSSLAGFATPLGSVTSTFENLTLNAEGLNKAFLGTRQRLQEMLGSINEAVPRITALGGEYKDAANTINQIAVGARRNVIATTEDITELFAAGKLVGKTVSEIVNDFANAGFTYERVADDIKDSIFLVQSLGQNARTVMQAVVDNTEKLSRYNFNDGVRGLTRMAAQASLLRFDMKDTFDLAEGLFKPERAIEVASAFQRLGVSVGNLADPFQLMNQSILDPSGLQESLINVAKSFTYFDEKTKSFRISPQGILTLKELQDQTGVNAENMRRAGLAAAELDARLAKINTVGFSMPVSEDDKKLIANIARMGTGEGADYEVTIKDDKGYEEQKKLSALTEGEFKRLIEQQKQAPKSIEDIQKKQLTTSEALLAEFRTLKETIASALIGLPGVTAQIDRGLSETREFAGSLPRLMEQAGVQKQMDVFRGQLMDARNIEDKEERRIREKEITDEAEEYLKSLGEKFAQNTKINVQEMLSSNFLSEKLFGTFKQFFDMDSSGRRRNPDTNYIPKRAEGGPVDANSKYLVGEKGPEIFVPQVKGEILPNIGNKPLISALSEQKVDVNINFPNSLKIDWNVDIPPGTDQKFVEAALTPAGKQAIYKAWQEQSYELGKSISKSIIPGMSS